jgi:hypothetical protein
VCQINLQVRKDEGENTMTTKDYAQLPEQTPAPDPELQRLEPLIGAWKAKDHTQDSILGPGVPVTNIEECFWLVGGYFLVQTYDTTFGDDLPQKGVNY